MVNIAQKFQKVTARNLEDALLEGLKKLNIDAQVETEKITGTKLHRVYIVSDEFEKLTHSDRQGIIWRIMDMYFEPDAQLQVSMIIALAPSELSDD